MFATGKGLDACKAIHAEQNALMQCQDVQKIVTAYVTAFPCMHCVKLLLNTPCDIIYYYDSYTEDSLKEWLSHGRKAVKVDRLASPYASA